MTDFQSQLKLNEELSISDNVIDVTYKIMHGCLDNFGKNPL